ncbi:regucalcin-like [Hyposmocoma kahamanoa]|uniref:regucalcin-like n=1 Tax=Hyposmocoma kahamanoa TaxID=1477025 RepID=UPI000E6D7769|nr:regucalcin-like [Hyposmocoma kahamanoa]
MTVGKVFLLYFILHIAAANDVKRFYKVSMVASLDNPGHPAVFLHGESAVWDTEQQCLYFVDVVQQNVHKLEYSTGKILTKHIAYGEPNLVTTVANSKRLIVSVRTSLYLLDFNSKGDSALRLLTTVENGQPDNVINEGKADVDGRFFFGTKGPQNADDVQPDRAALYSVTQDSLDNPRIIIKPVSISNGLVWALNNTVFYYIDSSTQRIVAYDYDTQKGDISGRRIIIEVAAYGYDESIPDGMTIDSNGNLWVALMFGGTVLHINPDARHVIFGYKLPVSRTTSMAWGGPNMDELFVTTSRLRVDQNAEPLAGAIFTIRDTGHHGMPHNSFRMDNADSY